MRKMMKLNIQISVKAEHLVKVFTVNTLVHAFYAEKGPPICLSVATLLTKSFRLVSKISRACSDTCTDYNSEIRTESFCLYKT